MSSKKVLVSEDLFKKLLEQNNNNIRPFLILSIVAIILLAYLVMKYKFGISIFREFTKLILKIGNKLGYMVRHREKRYQRDVKIGKIDAKRRRVKTYRFLNDLIIDLGLKKKGSTPYSFLCAVIIASCISALLITEIVFGNLFMAIILAPLILALILCSLYTKANVAHDARIEAILESENIISNNIKAGVIPAVRNSIDLMPKIVQPEYRDFLDNVEQKNYHIRTALVELNNNLGSVADDFIKKCIEFETSEEHGIAGMFRDVVEVNNVKLEMRILMKRKFEEVVNQFIIGTSMIVVFLAFIIIGFDVVREFYFKNIIGQLLICMDILIVVGEFVFITYLRAKDM